MFSQSGAFHCVIPFAVAMNTGLLAFLRLSLVVVIGFLLSSASAQPKWVKDKHMTNEAQNHGWFELFSNEQFLEVAWIFSDWLENIFMTF